MYEASNGTEYRFRREEESVVSESSNRGRTNDASERRASLTGLHLFCTGTCLDFREYLILYICNILNS